MRRGPGRFRDGRRVYQRLSDALNHAAPSSPLKTSPKAADEPDDEQDDENQADQPDSPTVVVPPRTSIAVSDSTEEEQEHDNYDDDPEHRAPPRDVRYRY